MIKSRIQLLPTTSLKLKTKNTLKYSTYGVCFALLFCCGFFAYQMIGNSENVKAGHKKKFHISNFEDGYKGEIAAAVEAEVTTTNDSMFIEFLSVDQSEIRSAVLNISSAGIENEKNIQEAKVFTALSSPNGQNYRISLALKNLPDKILIQAKVNFKSPSIEEAQEVKSNFTFDKKTSSVSL